MTERRQVGLEHLTLLEVPPPDFVSLAADAGFDCVGLRVAPATPGEQPWPVNPGTPMLAETVRRAEACGIAILDVEAIRLHPSFELAECVQSLETAAELGARFVNVIGDDYDISRLSDRFCELTRIALAYGVRPVIEFMAYKPVRTLEMAVHIAQRSEGGGILLDALHVQRCGTDLRSIAAVDPSLLTYVQLCDAPLRAPIGLAAPTRLPRDQVATTGDAPLEARMYRLLPGDGQLPLLSLLAVLPSTLPVAVEAPGPGGSDGQDPTHVAALARRSLNRLLSAATSAGHEEPAHVEPSERLGGNEVNRTTRVLPKEGRTT